MFHLIKSLTSLYITITLDTTSPLIDQTPIVYCTSKPRETETYGILLFSLFRKRINHHFIGLTHLECWENIQRSPNILSGFFRL